MALEIHDYNRDSQSLRDQCRRYMFCHVMLTRADGTIMDGIIEDMDEDNVTMLVGEDVMEEDNNAPSMQYRQFNPQGRQRRRFRRFRRRRFPFRDLSRLFVVFLPFQF